MLASQVHVSTPPTGSVVTLSFSSRDRPHLPSSPSSPSVSRLRHDLLWDDCLLNFAKDNKHPSGIIIIIIFIIIVFNGNV